MESFDKGNKVESFNYEADEFGFVNFGEVARNELNQQSQYASRYVDGSLDDYPNLGEGLRFEGNPDDYHGLKIHKDDINEFVERVSAYKKSKLMS